MMKIVGMLVALAVFCAMPAVAFAGSDGDNVSSGNTQNGEIDQGAAGGDSTAGSGSGDGEGTGGDAGSGDGGDAGNQACLIQQNAGRDANAECNQSQNFGGDTFVDADGDGVRDHDEVRGHVRGHARHGVQSVRLARTGFDVGLLALAGGIALATGAALLVMQRRRVS